MDLGSTSNWNPMYTREKPMMPALFTGNNMPGPGLLDPRMQTLLSSINVLNNTVKQLVTQQVAQQTAIQSNGNNPNPGIIPNLRQLPSTASNQVFQLDVRSRLGKRVEAPTTSTGEKCRLLLVENVPSSIANPDVIYRIFSTYGVVERVKILYKDNSTALVQMGSSDGAEIAVQSQAALNRNGLNIIVKFCTNIMEITVPERGISSDGNTKDFTKIVANPHSKSVNMDTTYGTKFFMGAKGDNSMEFGSGTCLLLNDLPDSLASPVSILNLLGNYGDVQKVVMLPKKPGSALVQMAKPHQAARCRDVLNHVKVDGKTIFITFSKAESLKLPKESNEDLAVDYSSRSIHRFRTRKFSENLETRLKPPTSTLFVSSIPDGKLNELKNYFVECGYTVVNWGTVAGKSGVSALIKLASIEEAIKAMAKLHNTMPEEIGEKKGERGLCLSFSTDNRKFDN